MSACAADAFSGISDGLSLSLVMAVEEQASTRHALCESMSV